MTKPRIFNILSFRKLEDDTRVVHSHMVAAFTSAEAEAEILEADQGVLSDCDLFISTDAIREQATHPNVCWYVSGATDTPTRERVPEATYQGWVRAVTRDEWHDGELSPATHRRITREAVAAGCEDCVDDQHDEAKCPECDGNGGDKWNDYCLPCPMCDGDGRLW